MSKNFEIIKRLVQDGILDNNNGFTANDVVNNSKNLNQNTIKTFLPKHAKIKTIYFERIRKGTYKIKVKYLEQKMVEMPLRRFLKTNTNYQK